MATLDDGDVIRALGTVALRSAYVEEAIDDCLEQFIGRGKAEERLRKQSARDKAKVLRRLINGTPFDEELAYLPALLHAVIETLEERNTVIHGRMYADPSGGIVRRSARHGVPDTPASSAELYGLADRLDEMLPHLLHASKFRLRRHLDRSAGEHRVTLPPP
ncbi:hypothetical protein [Cupriavidus pampae]|uniref:hypothetical protein n=1 Tax=Cupriavidus pampae TaxID=659251 RepID=UPI001CC4B5ED|nr:hypothetical protein [Cupriavidus pampae]